MGIEISVKANGWRSQDIPRSKADCGISQGWHKHISKCGERKISTATVQELIQKYESIRILDGRAAGIRGKLIC